MRAWQGGMMRAHYGRLGAALVAASMLGAPLAAQTAACDSCTPARAASRDALEQARRTLDAATKQLMERRAAWYDNDTSRALRDSLVQAERQLRTAQRNYQVQAAEALRMQAQISERQMRAEMEHARVMQRNDQRGWLGLTLSDARAQGATRDLPLIVAVDPGSPADHAGMQAGDVIVAVNGQSLQKGMPAFERFLHPLRPGARIQMRVQHGDETKNVTVRAGQRPRSYVIRFGPDRDSMELSVPAAAVAPMPPMPSSVPIPALPPMAPAPEVALSAPLSGFYFNGVATIAGAQLWDVDQLRDYFHVDDGLLVLRVLPGTPADRAGLRSGDVIVSTDGRAMSSIRSLERTLERADDSSDGHIVKLAVVRKGKRMTVALRW